MTVNNSTSRQVLLGDGTTISFPFDFSFPASTTPGAFIQVSYIDPSGVTKLLDPKSYTLFTSAPLGANPTPVGGHVVYNPPSGPIPLGSLLVIQRNIPLVQETSLANQGTLYQTTLEQALDYSMMAIQQVAEGTMVVPPPTPPPGPLHGPIIGITDGSPANPGEVGEFLMGTATLSVAVNAGRQTLSAQPLVLTPGDWDVQASCLVDNVFDALLFILSPVPSGLSSDLAGFMGVYINPPEAQAVVVSPRAQALVSVPTLLPFTVLFDAVPVAMTATLRVTARRMR